MTGAFLTVGAVALVGLVLLGLVSLETWASKHHDTEPVIL